MGGAAVSTAAFMVLPGAVLGLRGATSPNEKLNLAGIGIGGQGGDDLGQLDRENIVALCDVNANAVKAASKRFPKARTYKDFRKLYDEANDIDAVVVRAIATILTSFGIEEEDRRELRADFQHLRRWRKSVEQAQSYTFKAVITIIVAGFLGATRSVSR